MTDLSAPPRTKAPWHLWTIGIVTLLWNAVGALDFVMTQTRNEEYMSGFTPAQLEYFYGFPKWVVVAWGIAVFGGVAGSILLLLRRALAFPVFAVSFVAMVLTTIYNFVLTNGMEIMGGLGPTIFSAVIFVVALLLVFYARSMKQRGYLS